MAEQSFMDRLRELRDDLMRNYYVFGLQFENVFKTDKLTDVLGIKWHNPDFELAMVKDKPECLKYIKNQTEEMCIAAVRWRGQSGALRNPAVLQYVKNQTPAICMAAVQNNGCALEYVKNQTPEICKAAIEEFPASLRYVKDQTPDLCMIAVRTDPRALEYVKEQTEELCMEAIKRNPSTFDFVKNPTLEMHVAARVGRGDIIGTTMFSTINKDPGEPRFGGSFVSAPKPLRPPKVLMNFSRGENCLDDLIVQAESQKIAPNVKPKIPVRKNEMEL